MHRRLTRWALVVATAWSLPACLVGANPNYPLTGGLDGGGSSGAPAPVSTSTAAPASTSAGTSSSTTDTTDTTGTTGTTGTTDPLGTTSSTTAPPLGCDESQLEQLDDDRPALVFVVERSATMALPWDHDGDANTPDIPRWASVRAAVEKVAARFDLTTRAGLSLLPATAATDDYGPAACTVQAPLELAPATMNAAAIAAALPPADAPAAGARPASAAITAAITALDDLADPEPIWKLILYVTGGAGNCHPDAGNNLPWLLEGYDETIHGTTFLALEQSSIFTHVIGVAVPDAVSPAVVDSQPDDVNPLAMLTLLADQGGDYELLNAAGEAALVDALDAAVRTAISCRITLDVLPEVPDSAQIVVDGVQYKKQGACGGGDGFAFPFENQDIYDTIDLCGQACRRFQEIGVATLKQFCEPG